MGDELGLLNDHGWADDPRHGGDNRWVHRPRMPWPPPPDSHGVRAGIDHLLRVRRGLPHLHAATPTEVWDPRDEGVLLVVRRHQDGPLLAAANVTGEERVVTGDVLAWLGLSADHLVDQLTGRAPLTREGDVVLPAYSPAWLVAGPPSDPALS